LVTFDHEKVGKISPPNNEWDTVVQDYGYDRIAKTEGSAVEITKGELWEFKKGSVIQFIVGDNNTDVKWVPADIINTSKM